MAKNDAVIIAGTLSDEDLKKSITALVSLVDKQTQTMAESFDRGITKMTEAIGRFTEASAKMARADEQRAKNSKRVQEANDREAASYDRIADANARVARGKSYGDGTIGALESAIKHEKEIRKEMQQGSPELQAQNDKIEQMTRALKEQLATVQQLNAQWVKQVEANEKIATLQRKQASKSITTEFEGARSMSVTNLDAAETKLKRLLAVQQQMRSSGLFDEKNLNEAQKAIDKVREKIQRLQEKKPRDLMDVLGMPTGSVDEINRKMRALRSLDMSDANAARQIRDEYKRLNEEKKKMLGVNAKAIESNNALARSFGYIRNRLIYAVTIGALTQFVKDIIEIRAQYELAERSLGVLVNSFEKGTQIFNELNQMALKSPFTLMELAGAAKQLTAYNFAANEVVETTRRLADISAALGVPMERLTYNLGQIRAQGVLTARDARDFANAGLPMVKSLADYFTEIEGRLVTSSDVYDRMSKKMVSYADVMAVLNKMTDEGGKFFEFQAKQAETLKVQLANLSLAYNNALNEIGESTQGTIHFWVGMLKWAMQNWEVFSNAITASLWALPIAKLGTFALAFKRISDVAAMSGRNINKFGVAARFAFGSTVTNGIKSFGKALTALAMSPTTWIFIVAAGIASIIQSVKAAHDAVRDFNKELKQNAKEASGYLDEYLRSEGNLLTRDTAAGHRLSGAMGQKAWESIREEIERSSDNAQAFISELMQIPDINDRVFKSFKYAEAIREAQLALADLKEDSIKVSQTIWGGVFGEGLADDAEDYIESIRTFVRAEKSTSVTRSMSGYAGIYARNLYRAAREELVRYSEEFNAELAVLTKSIRKELVKFGMMDLEGNIVKGYEIQVREILARIKNQIAADNLDMKPETFNLISVELDKAIIGNAADTVEKLFFDRLKSHSSRLFTDLTDDWIKSSKKYTEAQQHALDENLEYFKKQMPQYADEWDKLAARMSTTEGRADIATRVGQVRILSNFQKEVNKRIAESPKVIDFGGEYLLPRMEDDLESWVERLQKEIASFEEKNKKLQRDNQTYSKEEIEANNTRIAQNKALLDLFNQLYHKDTKGGGSQKDIFGDALKKEIELISEMQKRYKEYVKMGVDGENAMAKASEEYGNSIRRNNETLKKYGVRTLDPESLAKLPIKDIRDFYTEQLSIAKKLGNTAGIEALEKVIAKLNVDLTKIDYESVTKGLSRALSDVKGEYEIAVDFQAMPELGQVFADMMGKSVADLNDLPRNWEEMASKMQTLIDKTFAEQAIGKDFSLMDNLNMAAFNQWVKDNGQDMDDAIVKILRDIVNQVNKVRQKETANQVESWNKLLEKYSDYEYQRKQIMETAERERQTAIKQGGGQDVIDAINTRERRDLASLDFSQFQQSQEWIMATGDLANLTDSALGLLVRRLEEYKKSAKNLDPKQIKQINNAIKQMKREMRSGNPFFTIANAIADAKENAAEFQPEIDAVVRQLDELDAKRQSGIELTDEEKERLKELVGRWQKLTDLQDKSGKVNAKQVVSGLQDIISTVSTVTSAFGDMANAIGGENMTSAAETLSNITTILDKAAQGAAVGAQIGSGWGALVGGVVGGLMGAVTAFADKWSGNKAISESIQKSERMVKRLQLAYIDLERAIDNAYGTASIGAQKIANENKKLQLQELKRQLELEESRKSKNRDDDKIIELQGEIKELENEISDATTQLVNDLLGVSSVGDAMDNMMSSFIDALRSGEDAMSVFDESIDDMIANMVKKMYVTKILQPWAEDVWNQLQSDVESRGAEAQSRLQDVQERLARGWQGDWVTIDNLPSYFDDYLAGVEKKKVYVEGKGRNDLIEKEKISWEDYLRILEQMQEDLEQQIVDATTYTVDDVKAYAEMLRSGRDVVANQYEEVDAAIEALGLKTATQDLSNLQQGIQGITEDTAGALEAYMNGVSQQVYLHTEILTQIRDAVTALNTDVNLSTQAQMLLQLQSNYQVMRSMESFMENWTLPSGNGIRVQLVS